MLVDREELLVILDVLHFPWYDGCNVRGFIEGVFSKVCWLPKVVSCSVFVRQMCGKCNDDLPFSACYYFFYS